jgi:hypothetical protein
MPPDVYARVKNITTLALQTVFTHVTAPFEVPGEFDYGDIDFLVSAPFGDTAELTLTTYPFQSVIESIKHALRTTHGRQGFFTPDCMWWNIWVRQCVVNWRGMWAKRFEKEDAKAEKAKEAEEEKGRKEKIGGEAKIKAEELVRAHKQKIMESSGTA